MPRATDVEITGLPGAGDRAEGARNGGVRVLPDDGSRRQDAGLVRAADGPASPTPGW
ncbi:hypothetical protein [Streptomyces sp. NPDC044948]|uniref:hypothetical protein n=1 Tax=Streptomyces sp. NPDC044948 TaxID=3157092 RepID=UPI0033CB81C1